MLNLRAFAAVSFALLHLPLAFGSSCDLTKRANTTKTEQEIWGSVSP